MSADRIKTCPFLGSDDIDDCCTARLDAQMRIKNLPDDSVGSGDLTRMATVLPSMAREGSTKQGHPYDQCTAPDDPGAQIGCNRNPNRNVGTVTNP